jgi:hypothetical protein
MHWVNQIVLPQNTLGDDVVLQQNADFYELVCNLKGQQTTVMRFYVGLVSYTSNLGGDREGFYRQLIENNTQTYLDVTSDTAINCFDYKTALSQWSISYVAVRDFTGLARFQDDPTYTLAFKNSAVAIYKVVA